MPIVYPAILYDQIDTYQYFAIRSRGRIIIPYHALLIPCLPNTMSYQTILVPRHITPYHAIPFHTQRSQGDIQGGAAQRPAAVLEVGRDRDMERLGTRVQTM